VLLPVAEESLDQLSQIARRDRDPLKPMSLELTYDDVEYGGSPIGIKGLGNTVV